MSESICIHEGDKHVGNICVPGRFEYQVATHARGARHWKPVGKRRRTVAAAFRDVGRILEDERGRSWRSINRVGIWACETGMSYYDPHQVYEVTVR